MATLTHIRDVLDAPKRVQEALRASTARRLRTLEIAEATVAKRTRDCDVREAVFRRALDAGVSRGAEEWLRRWVETELLPSLAPPTAVTVLAGELEERAAELDAFLIELEERELMLRHERDMLQLASSEVRVREEEVERRVRVSAALSSKVEAQVDERSKYHLGVRDKLIHEAYLAKASAVAAHEKAGRLEIELKWSAWCTLRLHEAHCLLRYAETEQKNIKSARNVLDKWRRKPPEPPVSAGAQQPTAVSDYPEMDNIDRTFPLQSLESMIIAPRATLPTEMNAAATSTTELLPEWNHGSARHEASLDRGIQHDAVQLQSVATQTRSTSETDVSVLQRKDPQQPSQSHRDPRSSFLDTKFQRVAPPPNVVVLPAFDTEGDLFDPQEEEYRQLYRLEAARIEGAQRAHEAKLAAREAELKKLYDYLQAQRREVDELSAHLLLRSSKMLEVEARQRKAADQLWRDQRRGQRGRSRGDDDEDSDGDDGGSRSGVGSDDEFSEALGAGRGREAAPAAGHFTVHPLLSFGRRQEPGASPIARRPSHYDDEDENDDGTMEGSPTYL